MDVNGLGKGSRAYATRAGELEICGTERFVVDSTLYDAHENVIRNIDYAEEISNFTKLQNKDANRMKKGGCPPLSLVE